MKLSELKPCPKCRGPIGNAPQALKTCPTFLSPRAMDATIGVATILGGCREPGALAIAEALSSDADVLKVLGEEDPSFWSSTVIVCQRCYLEHFAVLFGDG